MDTEGSADVAVFPLRGQGLERLCTATNKALYEAKNSGRDQIRVALFNSP